MAILVYNGSKFSRDDEFHFKSITQDAGIDVSKVCTIQNVSQDSVYVIYGGTYSTGLAYKNIIKTKYPQSSVIFTEGGILNNTLIVSKEFQYYDYMCTCHDNMQYPIVNGNLVEHIKSHVPTKFKQSKDNIAFINHINNIKKKQKIHLLIGQVRMDNSIAYARGFYSIADVTRHIRSIIDPNAYIVFKPHPEDFFINDFADINIADISISTLLNISDIVHVMSSGAGAEALLNNKVVHTYCTSFYSHRGLTIDHVCFDNSQRQKIRQCTIDQFINYFYLMAHKSNVRTLEQIVKEHVPR